jgi:hypothetical protein
MERSEPKSILELKVNQRTMNQNINRIYSICSALYQEIQDIKHFVNFKHTDKPNIPNNMPSTNTDNSRTIQKSMNVLENLGDFADSLPKTNTANNGRKLKIINN